MKKAHEAIALNAGLGRLYAKRRGRRRGEAWYRDRLGKRHAVTLKALDAMLAAGVFRFSFHGNGGVVVYTLTPEAREHAEGLREGEN